MRKTDRKSQSTEREQYIKSQKERKTHHIDQVERKHVKDNNNTCHRCKEYYVIRQYDLETNENHIIAVSESKNLGRS